MPRYDFQCDKCQALFELSLSLAERDEGTSKKRCPACGSLQVHQLITFNGGIISGGKSKGREISGCSSGCCASQQFACAGGNCPLD